MTARVRLIAPVMAVLLLLTGCGSTSKTNQPTDIPRATDVRPAPQTGKLSPYVASPLSPATLRGFNLKHPADWQKQVSSSDTDLLTFGQGANFTFKSIYPQWVVDHWHLQKPFDPVKVKDLWLAQRSQDLGALSVTAEAPAKAAGLTGWRFERSRVNTLNRTDNVTYLLVEGDTVLELAVQQDTQAQWFNPERWAAIGKALDSVIPTLARAK